jgi:Zn ribbon nucleic-acid-binding protein
MENQKYLQMKNNIKYKLRRIKKKYENRKTKIYKKCPKCKTILRLSLPSKRGIKHITCPKCQKRITMLCLRKEKIEVIVKKKRKK